MKLLRSPRARLFLVVWAASTLCFATNVVREHYPAMALARHGDLRCDEWAVGWPDDARSSDLFQYQHVDATHGDGHWYANNNVGASLVAAPFLFLAEPLLAKLDEIGRQQSDRTANAGEASQSATFDSPYPRRQKFMAEVRRRGLQLRLGAVAAITTTFVMAPAAALLTLLLFDALRRRGVAERRATALALIFAFATPLLFRSAILNHNQLEALAAFGAYVVLLGVGSPRSAQTRSSARTFAIAGLLAGATVLFDYSGVVLLVGLGLLAWRRAWSAATEETGTGAAGDTRGAIARPLAAFAVGAAIPLALLCSTQWWQFGDPFAPAQRWMPDAHYSVRGWHGFDVPSLDLVVKNLVDPSFGLFAFAPILLLSLWPARRAATTNVTSPSSPSFGSFETTFVLSLAAAFVLFCAANQFTRLQWNTGFRGLAPLVPFLFLAASDVLARVSSRTLAIVAIPCVLHSLVLAMARATPRDAPAGFADSTIAQSWAAFFQHGVQLPWLTVWRQTQPGDGPPWATFAALLIVASATAVGVVLWRCGDRAARSAVATSTREETVRSAA